MEQRFDGANSGTVSDPIERPRRRRKEGYDKLAQRRFEFVPLWGIAVFLLYAMRRAACPQCGVKVETVRLGKRQASTHRHLCLVPGTLGETTVVEGSGRSFPYELGEGVSLGGDGGRMGACASGPLGGQCDRHR